MTHMIYSEQDLVNALDSIQRVIEQSRTNIEQKKWPQLNSKLRRIDDELRYAMLVAAALSVNVDEGARP